MMGFASSRGTRINNHRLEKSAFGLALMLVFSLCADGAIIHMPEGQPRQMVSKAIFSSALNDSFFDSDEWSYPWWIIKHGDGHFENTLDGPTDEKDIPKLTHTAKCLSTLQYDHPVKFAEAKMQADGSIELFIHDESASTADSLLVTYKDGKFTSQYWTSYAAKPRGMTLVWTTKKQKLTLDKKVYAKGDTIRGKIEFECVQQAVNPNNRDRNPLRIKISGFLKPKLE